MGNPYDHVETEELMNRYRETANSICPDFGDMLLMLEVLEAREAF